MPFTTEVLLRAPLMDGGYWIVAEPLNFQSNIFKYPDGKPKNYVVERGYVTDLASVPRLPIVYWLVGNRGAAAAVVHDFLYSDGMRLHMIESRGEADDVYREALLDEGISSYLADMMFWGVRTFGESHFNW